MGGGGGGSAGKVEWPEYFEDAHKDWINSGIGTNIAVDSSKVSVTQTIYELYDNSPYALATAYDPTTELGDMGDELDNFQTEVKALSPSDDYDTYITKAKSAADDVLNASDVSDVVDQFEANQRPQVLKVLGRFASAMGDLGASMSSAMWIGLALLQEQHVRDVASFEASLRYRLQELKGSFTTQHLQILFQSLFNKISSYQSMVTMTAEVNRISLLARREENDREVDLMVRDYLWNLDIWAPAGNLLAAAQGGVSANQDETKAPKQSALATGLQVAGMALMAYNMFSSPAPSSLDASTNAYGSVPAAQPTPPSMPAGTPIPG